MSTKHYNANYLEDTSKFLKNLKEYSYSFFDNIYEGSLIDLGCGTGADIFKMSETLNPNLQLIGIDHDSQMLEQAKKLNANKANVSFIQSEAYKTPFENESIVGIRTERMIQHLKEPNLAFKEFYRILKKDHRLLIIETDWDSLNIYNEHYPISEKIVDFLTHRKVNNGMAAKQLGFYLNEHQFREIKLEVFPFVLKSLEEANNYLWLETIIQEVKEMEAITQQEFEIFENCIKKSDLDNRFSCSINLVLATAIK